MWLAPFSTRRRVSLFRRLSCGGETMQGFQMFILLIIAIGILLSSGMISDPTLQKC